MPSPIEALQSGGYSNDEISAWSIERRQALKNGGFADNEIDAYFTGGVVAPTTIPQTFHDRIAAGEAAGMRELGLIQSVPQFANMVMTPEGRGKLWAAAKEHPVVVIAGWLATLGAGPAATASEITKAFMTRDGKLLTAAEQFAEPLKVPGKVASGELDLNTEEGMDQALGLGMLIGLGRFSKINKTGKTSGLSVAKGEPIARVEKSPTGEVFDQTIGGLPTSQHFVDAAKAITVHPAERIQSAAIQLKSGEVFSGVTHADALENAMQSRGAGSAMVGVKIDDAYLTSTGRIVGRHEAAQIADAADQIKRGGVSKEIGLLAEQLEEPAYKEPVGVFPEEQTLKAIQTKLLSLYEDLGRLPAEVAHDAQTDPVILQKLLSKDPRDIPYGGQPPQGPVATTGQPPPPPPPAAGAPPAAPTPPGAPMTLAQAQQAIHSKIDIGGRGGPGYTVSQFYRDFVDDLYPLKGYSEDAYQAARRTRGDVGRANYFLEQSTTDFKTYRNNGPSLREVLEPVRDDLDGLRDYLAAKRALELEGRGINSGFDPAAAQMVVARGHNQYAPIGQQLVDYQNRVLAYLRDAGVIADYQYLAITDANKSFIPFNRHIEPDDIMGHRRGGGLGAGDPIKRLVGSDRDIVDPLESIIKNTYIHVSVAERNAAGLKLIDELQRQGYRATNPAPDARDKISAYRNGQRVEMAVDDPELVAAFKALDRDSVGTIAKILSYPASWLRAGAILTPEFMARNPMRDLLSAFVFSARGIFSPIDTAKGLVGVLRRDADWQNWIKSGGANSTLVGLDRQYLQESLAKLNAATGLMNRSWNVIKSPIEGLRMISELTENATRLGEFKKVMQGQAGKAAMEEAAFSSREVTLDFARMGAKMRAWNAISAFANAHIQGPDRLARAFLDRPINTSAKVLAGITAPSALLWWANHDDERYKELPDWQKDLFWIIPTDSWQPISAADAGGKPAHLLRQRGDQWEFNNGNIWRVPKPFEIGVLFGSGVERALDYMYGNNPEAFEGFSKSVMNTLMPNVIPTIAVPLYEQWANRSSFTDRTLIPAYVEKLLPEYQYTPYTTELSKKLGQTISAFPGMRTAAVEPGNVAGPMARGLTTPILVENYVRAWSGGLGMYVMQGTDALMRKAGVLPDPVKPTDTLADMPFVKAFVVRYPSASAESIQRFHDDYQENKRYFDTWTAKAKEGDVEAMARIQAAGGDTMFVQLDKINETISEHSKLVRDIYKYPMPAEEKRQLIDQLYYSMIEIAKTGREVARQAKQTLQ